MRNRWLFVPVLLLFHTTSKAELVTLEYCTDLLANQIIAFEAYLEEGAEFVSVQCTKGRHGEYQMLLNADCKQGPGVTENTVGISATGIKKGCDAWHYRRNDCPEFVTGAILDQRNTLKGKRGAGNFRRILEKECQEYEPPDE